MEKEILIQNLKTKVGEDNCKVISDRTFEGIATVYLPMFADDSAVTEETWKFPVAALNEFAGQKRFDEKAFTEKFKADYAKQYAEQQEKSVEERIRAAAAKAVEDYKKEHPENGGNGGGNGGSSKDELDAKVQEAVKNALAGLTGADSEFGKMSALVANFVKSQQEREKTDVLNRIKAELQGYLTETEKTARNGGEIPTEITALIEDTVKNLDYGENPTFDGLKASVTAAYEKEFKRRYPNGGKPFGGNSTNGNGGSSDFVKDRIAKLKKEAEDNANYASEIEKTFC